MLVAIAALLVSGALAARGYVRFADAAAEVNRTYDVLVSIDQVWGRLLDAESGQRGYLLTGDSEFLRSYDGVHDRTRDALGQLSTHLTDDPPQQQALARRFSELAERKLEEMARVVALHHAGDVAGAIEAIAAGGTRRTMEEVRVVANNMRAAEREGLAERADEARLARRGALAFAGLSVLIALSLAAAAALVQRDFERRRHAFTQQLSARLAAESHAVARAADLQQSERFNRSILDHSADCIQVLDPEARVIQTNRTGVALMELDDDCDGEGMLWPTLWGPSADLAWKAIHDASHDGDGRFQASRPTRQNRERWWDVIVTPIRDEHGQVRTLVTISRDVTEHKQAEEQRAALLASERAARSEAERAARMKDEFVSTLSHELRTPLNAILGWVAVLKRDRSVETTTKALDVIDRNARRQSQMVDDLLDLSGIISGKLRLDVQRVDLSGVVEEAVASAQPAADARGVRLVQVLDAAATVQGDAGRLQQVVWNLVSNGIKFTTQGGTVRVSLSTMPGEAQIEVSDTGQGVPPDMLPHIFERFRQVDTSSGRRVGGLGLGLAIVKNLVEMHGGVVTAQSAGENAGSTFIVRLPLAAVSPATAVQEPAANLRVVGSVVTLDGVVAMVLDDDGDARELVRRLLEDAGAKVTTSARALDALATLEQGFVPDIILSDIGMPDQDGYDFIIRVRQMKGAFATVPAAALTALARVEDRTRALVAGYQTHLAKPIDAAELIAMVASLTKHSGRQLP